MFVSYVMNEIDLTAVSSIWIKCTTHARDRSHVIDFKLLASEF